MRDFNLSDWGLRHRSVVVYFMVALVLIGASAYFRLGQSEDPPFTFKVMVVRTEWPGATAQEVASQVTERIEKKLQEIPQVDVVRSYSKPGESLVFFQGNDATPAKEVPGIWYQIRKKVGDMRGSLPAGVAGPYFNDEFGDVYGNIFALTGDLPPAELKRHGEAVRAELLRVPDVAKVSFFGEQTEKIYLELSNAKLATLGLSLEDLISALGRQNAEVAGGYFETSTERIYLRPDGQFQDVAAIRATVIRAGGRSFQLGDVAEVRRGYGDPPQEKMRFMGQEALGVGVSMRAGGDIVALGLRLDEVAARIQQQLPLGISFERVADQPRAVRRAVGEFASSLAEAVLIVLVVCLLSLGFRTGVVVAISIPVVLAGTFLVMYLTGVGLHKISLGALILALGLLVDDAIIAVEMMATKMEQGWDRVRAAGYAYTSTAIPMLSGTLVMVAGFLPIATAASATGEYTRSLFQVTSIALLISWVAAVLFVPYLGFRLLPDFSRPALAPGRLQRRLLRVFPRLGRRLGLPRASHPPVHDEYAIYHTAFYTRFRALVAWCVDHRWTVIGLTLGVCLVAVWAMRLVPQQFFPDSTRPELMVDLRLPEGSSYQATEGAVRRVEGLLESEPGIENYVAYVGSGSPRFYLPQDQQLPQVNFAQLVVLTAGPAQREALRDKLIAYFSADASGVRGSVVRVENGPPVGFPVQYRVSGPDYATLRQLSHEVAAVMKSHRELSNVHLDWEEPSKVVRLRIDQDKVRLLGLSSQEVSNFLHTSLNGLTVTQYREGTELISVVLRAGAHERGRLDLLPDLALPVKGGPSVPLGQIASLDYGFEEGVIWRRNRLPTMTVRANLYGAIQPAQVVQQLAPAMAAIRDKLPLGYHLEVGGAVEESGKGGTSVAAGMPLFVMAVLTVLMLQLRSFSLTAMVVLSAPLGLIGVVAALLLFGKPFGFVAMLGTIALSGMIMRNSVILVDQIRQDREAGRPDWEAIIESTVRRCRPIVLTAAAAILAMIPLTRSAFFGPMAVALMGGLTVATLLTLLFLPALYAAWFRVPRGAAGQAKSGS